MPPRWLELGGSMPSQPPDFDLVFDRLKALTLPFARGLEAGSSGPFYYLNTRHQLPNKQMLNFVALRKGKAYVSFYLFPVYMYPELLKDISPALMKRMQGKSCFNFKTVDEALFKELGRMMKAGLARYKEEGFLKK
jgi:hypothetical protein